MSFNTSLPSPVRRGDRRQRISLRLEDWPEPDRKAWSAAFIEADIFDEVGQGAHLAKATRVGLTNAYGRWLGFLTRSDSLALALAPGDRVTRERIVAFCRHLAETNRGSSIASLLGHLRQAARLLEPRNEFTWLLTIQKRIAAQFSKRSKRHRLKQSDELYLLGRRLMADAEAATGSRYEPDRSTAELYRDGLIIVVLASTGLRRRSLTSLNLDDLSKVGDRYTLLAREETTKNREALEFPLSADVSRALERYVRIYRPSFCRADTHRALWASSHGRPLTGGGLYMAVCRRTAAEFGQSVNPHLFRDAANTFWAHMAPDSVLGASALLGHQPRNSRHYNQAQAIVATRTMAGIIEGRRSAR